jgi:hypothetical protein
VRTRMMDDGQLAVGLFYFDLGRSWLDAEDVVVGRIDNHTEGVCYGVGAVCALLGRRFCGAGMNR